jgi:type VI secretion system protein ImpJ
VSQQTPLSIIPDAILWHEGMLLRPEHFEQLTARQELLLQHHASSAPFAWGISRLIVDEAALLQGRFTLLQLDARLPDGLTIHISQSDDREQSTQPSIDLATLDVSFQQKAFLVYLAVIALQPGALSTTDLRSVAATEADENLRQGGASLPEEGEEEEHLPIPRSRPRFHLIASQQGVSSKYVSMPIAKIGFRNGIWAMDDRYIPPAERIPSNSPLAGSCADVLRHVRELAIVIHDRFCAMSAKERGQNQHELTAVRSLVASLPYCEALIAAGCVHPFSLYLGFCSLAGHISGLSAQSIPPTFLPYNHNDLALSFAELNVYINQVLSERDSREYFGVPFTFHQNALSISFAREWSGRRLILALRASGNNDSGATAWCESALMGSRKFQSSMRERRVLGAQRTRINSEPGLFAGSGVILYQLHEDHDYLQPDEPFDLVTGPSIPSIDIPVEITLYVRQISN